MVCHGLLGIPATVFGGVELVEQRNLVVPRQLCKHLLHKFHLGPGLGKGTHVFQVAWRESLHVRKRRAQVMRQPVDHLGTPALGALAYQNVLAHLPVQAHQLAVDGQRRTLLGTVDAGF